MSEDGFVRQRLLMLEDIAIEAASGCADIGMAQLDERVIAAMSCVPRHEFVPDDQRAQAYQNRPLPIGYGKTISQPFIVALMTSLLQLQPDETVLEIGSGLGYQTSILSRLARQVYSIELIEGLARQARERLARQGYDNVEIKVGNGHLGWPEHAPYDKIIVTAAPQWVPSALLEQLRCGGRMVLPMGPPYYQQLLLICKDPSGEIETHEILPVLFSALERGE